jgi:Ni,Fe-hydrogenase I cytochrome b subunit
MQNVLKVFHYLGYVGVPLLLVGLFFIYRPFFMPEGYDSLRDISMGMLVMGFAVGLTSLRDHTKINKLSHMILSRPNFIRGFILTLGLIMIAGCIFSIYFIYVSDKPGIREASIGIMSLCLGGFGVLKTMISMVRDYESGKLSLK